MEQWKIEMINLIMKSDNGIIETVANVIDYSYTDEDIHLDNLAEELVSLDEGNAVDLKDYLTSELSDR